MHNPQHKEAIDRCFSRAAGGYQRYAELQRTTGETLLSLSKSRVSADVCIDLGCGSGQFLPALSGYSQQLIGLDRSADMLNMSHQHCPQAQLLQGDAEQLPLASNSIDRIYSNLALQWCDSLGRALAECYRVLKPGGELLLTTLAEGTLHELSRSFARVDNHPHIQAMLTYSQISALFDGQPWLQADYHCQPLVLHYASLGQLLRDLKGFGGSHVQSRRTGLMTPRQLQQVEQTYRQLFVDKQQRWPATYQVVYGVFKK